MATLTRSCFPEVVFPTTGLPARDILLVRLIVKEEKRWRRRRGVVFIISSGIRELKWRPVCACAVEMVKINNRSGLIGDS